MADCQAATRTPRRGFFVARRRGSLRTDGMAEARMGERDDGPRLGAFRWLAPCPGSAIRAIQSHPRAVLQCRAGQFTMGAIHDVPETGMIDEF